MNCSKWRPGVVITEHTKAYDKELADSVFCLALPGDGWSSRVLDAVVHGCVPVIIQDESNMFFEGIFNLVGAELDYDDFSIRIPEHELPRLLEHLDEVTPAQFAKYQRNVLWVRDYFVYKELWSTCRYMRKELMGRGRAGPRVTMRSCCWRWRSGGGRDRLAPSCDLPSSPHTAVGPPHTRAVAREKPRALGVGVA